ncbi:MAG: hypothetical protein HW405_4 [Candidatus Berkelbacteria bacterium]|nr:hypothetical protein [Candidatus Berkelbacteria bacterium]
MSIEQEGGLRTDLSGEQFLHQKNPKLYTSGPVEHEIERQKIAGETVPPKPANKIAEWLEVIEHTHTEHQDDPRVAERLKNYYHDNYVIKPEDIPESTFLLEQRIARNEGHGTVEITDEFRERKTQQIITDQKVSLDKWFDYLTSEDAVYPMWAKYWAFTSMLQMGAFVKEEQGESEEKKEFAHFNARDKNKNTTTASFPTLNPRALAMAIGVMQSKLEQGQKPKNEREPVANTSTKLDNPSFQQLLSTENFSKLYAQFLIEMPEYSIQGLRETRGHWVKYDKGSDPKPLVDSLDGYPLEWCTANIDTARTQLQGGDFYVYYSINEVGQAVIPRLAIRMQDNKIAENPRGIAQNQNIDPYIGEVLDRKLNEFPDKSEFQKKASDMKQMTRIHRKHEDGQQLTQAELVFLYELNAPIEGFGYEKDPRVAELRNQRNSREDAPIVFGCDPSEIAWGPSGVYEFTKVYIGPLFKGIFKELAHCEHIYTAFPEARIRRSSLEIGGKSAQELKRELEQKGFKIYDYARDMLRSPDFTTLKNPEQIDLVRVKVRDLGFTSGATTDQIYARAAELGLDLCPAEVGPHQRLKDVDQPMGDYYRIAMKQITGRYGRPKVFYLNRYADGLWLHDYIANPTRKWDPDLVFVFRLRKVSTES